MKTEFRVSAKTVSEAYTKAIELYSSLGEISYEIVQEGKSGFLGIFGNNVAHIFKHTLHALRITDVLLTAIG